MLPVSRSLHSVSQLIVHRYRTPIPQHNISVSFALLTDRLVAGWSRGEDCFIVCPWLKRGFQADSVRWMKRARTIKEAAVLMIHLNADPFRVKTTRLRLCRLLDSRKCYADASNPKNHDLLVGDSSLGRKRCGVGQVGALSGGSDHRSVVWFGRSHLKMLARRR